jgi:hypothetical protein
MMFFSRMKPVSGNFAAGDVDAAMGAVASNPFIVFSATSKIA